MIDFDWIWYFFENCCFLSLFYFISLLNRGMVVLALSQRKWFKPIVPHLLLIFRLTPKFFALCFFNMFGWHVSIVSFVGHWLNIPAHHSHVEYLSEIYVDVCIIMLYLISADKKQNDLESSPPPKKTVAVTVIVASAGSEMWSTTNEQGHGCSPRGTWIYFRNAVPVLITSIRLSNYLDWYSSLLFGPHKELFYISFKLYFVSPVTKEADEIGAWIL